MESRAIFIIFQVETTSVGVRNVCAPTALGFRRTCWRQLIDSLPQADMWIVRGDFIMIEFSEDKVG